jgi:glycosyltransferase involved in cell wall biosynthesis
MKKTRKKICMVTTSEIFHDSRILNEAKTLAKNYQVTILAKKYPGQVRKKMPFSIKLIPYWRLPWFQLDIFSSFLSLIKAAFREKADIYHAHDLDGLLCAFAAALLKGKILIYDSHELWSATYPFANLRGLRFLLPPLEKILIWRVRAGLTVNQSLADYLSKKYHRHFLALYNAASLSEKRNPTKIQLNLRQKFPGKKIILHLGAADEGRGMEEIIQAAQYLPEKFILVFVGGGKTENEAKNLALKLGLKNIHFFPAVPPEEILPTIAQADLGLALTQKVSLSYYLSLPNKIFQYLAGGLPILGSNFPEFKKVIKAHGLGETVDPSRPKLIAKKIQAMLNPQKQKIYHQRLARAFQDHYNWDIEGQKLLKFYQSII